MVREELAKKKSEKIAKNEYIEELKNIKA